MAYPTQRRLNEKYVTVVGAPVTGPVTISVAAPGRGEIKAIYLAPADGNAMTGTSALLTVSVENISVGTVTLLATAAGFASGGDTSFSPRAFVVDGDIIKLALAAGLTNATNAVFTIVLTERTA